MLNESTTNLSIALAPSGQLYLNKDIDEQEAISSEILQKIEPYFIENYASGLLQLGLNNIGALPPTFYFWQEFSRKFITKICHLPDINEQSEIPEISLPSHEELKEFLMHTPFMKGGEYLNEELLGIIWNDLIAALTEELKKFSGNLKELLNVYDTSWNLVGRVCFHLAENKNNQESPFAFLATYTTKLSSQNALKHIPLGRALEEYSGEKNKSALLAC